MPNQLPPPDPRYAAVRAEYDAWRAFSETVKEVTGGEGSTHARTCSCEAAGCRLYRAARKWGEALIAQEVKKIA